MFVIKAKTVINVVTQKCLKFLVRSRRYSDILFQSEYACDVNCV